MRRSSLLVRSAAAAALVLALAGCTQGGQFDPTAIFNNDMFDTKKKLQGEREPVFPNGVPGTTSGVPADLVKGYQAPPDQADAAPPPEPAKPKPKPKPKVARGPATPPPRISVSPTAAPAAAPAQQGAPAQTNWPAPPPNAPPQQGAPPSQPAWPDPPKNPQ